jgi:periplasmic protein TonB
MPAPADLQPTLPDVFSVSELAEALGCPVTYVQAWVEAGAIRTLPNGDGRTWLARGEAVRAARALADGSIGDGVTFAAVTPPEYLFELRRSVREGFRAPFAVSSTLHLGVVAAIVLVTMLGFGHVTATTSDSVEQEPLRLVYLALPGPGGGGGGGGLREKVKPPRAERQGKNRLDSPLPRREPPPTEPEPPKQEPPKPPDPLPEVVAPIAESAANERDRVGVPQPVAEVAESHGSGDGGGVGTGTGNGAGEGTGSGVGEGEGGGTGGGPFRPGSGIAPPSLLREVKPDYTEEARRRGIRGEVVMEIVVRRDGTVGEVRVLQGLGYGLDERAITAVKQWKFSPASRHGTPVDVMVEVAMEFRLR